MSIATNLSNIKSQLPEQVSLIAVSKTKPVSSLQEAYEAGQRDFGENYIQELQEKQPLLPQDIRWHFIGHLQSNKVKYIAPYIHLIHGVDSLKLLAEINKQALKNNRSIDCLLQVYIASEESKFGLSPEEVVQLLDSAEFEQLNNISITGLMAMASFSEDEALLSNEFSTAKQLFEQLAQRFPAHPRIKMQTLSMGMSGDYPLAIEHGSNMIRVGSSIFGSR